MSKSRTATKQQAQDILMRHIGNALGYLHEDFRTHGMSEAELAELHAELKRQADRIARLFGYAEAWSN